MQFGMEDVVLTFTIRGSRKCQSINQSLSPHFPVKPDNTSKGLSKLYSDLRSENLQIHPEQQGALEARKKVDKDTQVHLNSLEFNH